MNPPLSPHPQPNPQAELSWIDKTFKDTSVLVLVLFAFCCGGIALILGIVGVVMCKDPVAKKNAILVLILSIISTLIGIAIQFGEVLSSM